MPRLNRGENQDTGCLSGPRKAITKGGKAADRAISADAKGAAKAVVQKAQELRNEASGNDSEQTPLAVANTAIDFSVVNHRKSVLVRKPNTSKDEKLAKQIHNDEKEAAGFYRTRKKSAGGQESSANTAVSTQWFKMDGGEAGRRKVSGEQAKAAVQKNRRNRIAASTAQAVPKYDDRTPSPQPSQSAMDLTLAKLADSDSESESEDKDQ